MIVSRRTALMSACLGALMAALPALAHDGVEIVGAYARFLPGAKSGAAYFTIENHASVDERLVAVTADVAERAELHTSMAGSDGMMQMQPIEGGIVIPPGQTRALESGGDHVMMMMLTRVPKPGETITLTLTFDHAGQVVVTVPVQTKP